MAGGYSETGDGISRKHDSYVDATNRERDPVQNSKGHGNPGFALRASPGTHSIRKMIPAGLPGAPLLRSDLPDFKRQSPADELFFSHIHYAHPLFFRDSPRGGVDGSLGHSQNGKTERLEPEVIDPYAGFAHEPLAAPWDTQPESAVVAIAFDQADRPDNLRWLGDQTDGPVPRIAALCLWKRDVSAILERAIRRVGPGHAVCQVSNHLPMRKQLLNLRRIGHLQRVENESFCSTFATHAP